MIQGLKFALFLTILSASALAQTSPSSTPAQSAAPAPMPTANLADLDKLEGLSAQVLGSLGHIRVEKWKADANSKQQGQANIDSIQRNLTTALPAMISSVRSAPQDANAEFRLYRNVNALYDVMVSLVESAGAFGPKSEYEPLAQQLESLDSLRRSLGDSVDSLTSSTRAQLGQLRLQLHAAQQAVAAAAAANPPKTTVVDDNQPAKKTSSSKKKTSAKKPSSSSTSQADTPSTASEPKQ